MQLINSINNALNFLGNSIAETRNQLQKLEQTVVTSHNVLQSQILNLRIGMIRSMPRAELSFEVALAEHCNLNCAGCDHFSPLAKAQLADFDAMANDFSRLSFLFNKNARQIHFLGGEPLLHPEITKFLVMARKNFPSANIDILSNGTLLLNRPQEFWDTCRNNNIVLNLTKYPISFNYDAVKKLAADNKVILKFFNNENVTKTLFHMSMDLNGLQDSRKNFLICHRANSCIYLQDGRLYTCTVAPTARHFDNKFGTHLFDEETNSIDIHKANSAGEILEFLARPIPFCRYCMIANTVGNIQWHQSKKTIDEWT